MSIQIRIGLVSQPKEKLRRKVLSGLDGHVWLIILALWLILPISGCQTVSPPTAVFHGDATAYNQFLTPTPLVPFLSRGSMYLRLGEQKESGEFLLSGTDYRRLRVQLMARITGSLVMELQLADEKLLFLDYLKETYFTGPNTRANRMKLFQFDLSAADFLLLVTGRIPKEEFEASGGRLFSGGYAEMTIGDSQYSFTLDKNGLLKRWVKGQQAKVIYRVEYGPYLLVPTDKGQTLRVPHQVRVYTDEEKPTFVLGVRDFKPGINELKPVDFELPPGKEWQLKIPPDPRLKTFQNL